MTDKYLFISKPLYWDEKNKRTVTARGGNTLRSHATVVKDAIWLAKKKKEAFIKAEKKRLGRKLTTEEYQAALQKGTNVL